MNQVLNFILVKNKYPFVVIKSVERKRYTDSLRLADNGEFASFSFSLRGAQNKPLIHILLS